jgi:hypothetical protein
VSDLGVVDDGSAILDDSSFVSFLDDNSGLSSLPDNPMDRLAGYVDFSSPGSSALSPSSFDEEEVERAIAMLLYPQNNCAGLPNATSLSDFALSANAAIDGALDGMFDYVEIPRDDVSAETEGLAV